MIVCLCVCNCDVTRWLSYWDSSEQWSTSIEVCACSCSGIWFPAREFEFCPAFDRNPLKMFEFCPAFDKKFAVDESQYCLNTIYVYWDSSRANFLSNAGQNWNIFKGFLSKAGQNSNSRAGNHIPLQEHAYTSMLALQCYNESQLAFLLLIFDNLIRVFRNFMKVSSLF